jgi:toxin FitB
MILVDTNVISELMRQRPNAGVLAWLADQQRLGSRVPIRWGISIISIEEIVYGLTSVAARKPTATLFDWFDSFLESHSVLPVTGPIATRAGRLRGQLQSNGQTRTQQDILLAATAIEHGLTLVTRNVRDFDDCGLGLLNPFS